MNRVLWDRYRADIEADVAKCTAKTHRVWPN